MGLDWMLQDSKPKEGREKEYKNLKRALLALDEDESLDASHKKMLCQKVRGELKKVAVSAFEVIQAPRVGVDEEATNWFRENVYRPRQERLVEELLKPPPKDPSKPRWEDRNEAFVSYWRRSFEEVLKDERGKYVPNLAKKTEGLATITGMLCSPLDFRGKVVALSTLVNKDLRHEAYEDHAARYCVDYAERLEDELFDYQHHHPDWAELVGATDYGKVKVKEEVEDLEAAIRWLRFWGSNGFGYSAWY